MYGALESVTVLRRNRNYPDIIIIFIVNSNVQRMFKVCSLKSALSEMAWIAVEWYLTRLSSPRIGWVTGRASGL